MATYTITTSVNHDSLTGKGGGDIYNINGGTLTIDGDTRYEQNAATLSVSGMNNINISSSVGGTLEVDGRFVRLIPFDNGSGTIPTAGTVISGGGGSGKLICVLSSLTAAPLLSGAAMPSTGWIKIKQWNSAAYNDDTVLSGITATVNGTDSVGWISVVGRQSSNVVVPRLGLARFRGAWLEIGTTTGSRSTTYQIPTAGETIYPVGVQIETAVSGVYEWYYNASSINALESAIGTEIERGKVAWISNTGLVHLGSDGTNQTGGYIPPAGRKIRIPNVWLHNVLSSGGSDNVVPNATLTSRFAFSTTNAGSVILDEVHCAWYLALENCYTVNITDCAINDSAVIGSCVTSVIFQKNCVSHTGTTNLRAFDFSNSSVESNIENNVFVRYQAGTGTDVFRLSNSENYISRNNIYRTTATRTNSTAQGIALSNVRDSLFENEILINCPFGGTFNGIVNSSNVTIKDLSYIDRPGGAPLLSLAFVSINFGTGGGNLNFLIDGLTFPVARNSSYSSAINLPSSSSFIKIRNIGTRANPLNLGGIVARNISYTRSGTTVTITSPNHGLASTQFLLILANSASNSPTNIVPGNRTTIATIVDSNTFTITTTNAGALAGTIDYQELLTSQIFDLTSTISSDITFQRIFTTPGRTGSALTDRTTCSRFKFENVGSSLNTFSTAASNSIQKGSYFRPITGATASVYGNHFSDHYIASEVPNRTNLSWSRTSTECTITSADHGLINGDVITVTISSDTTAIALGTKTTIYATGKDTFAFACNNAGATSGTLTFIPHNGQLFLRGNEFTSATSSYVTFTAGTPRFNGGGDIVMASVGDQVVWEWDYFIKGHSQFVPSDITLDNTGVTNFDIEYQINQGSNWSAWKALSYRRGGAAGTSGASIITMTDTTGVQVNDYVFGTNVGAFAQVVSVDSSTQITVSVPNAGNISSASIRFNRLPLETITSSVTGFKLRIRITTQVAGTNTVRNLRIPIANTASDRDNLYTLDTSSLTITNLVANSRVRITKNSNNELLINQTAASNIFSTIVDFEGLVDIEVRNASGAIPYKPWRTQVDLSTTTPTSIIALQERDDL